MEIDNHINFLFIAQWDRYIFRRKGQWDRLTTYSKDAVSHHLANKGLSSKEVAQVMKERRYPMVYEVVMAPGEAEVFDDGAMKYLNIYITPTLAAQEGTYPSIERLLNHLTNGDAEGRRWLEHWIAWKVQDPSVVPKVAAVITTEPGGGKGTLAYIMRQMLGPKNCETIEKEDLENRFNAKWVDKIFVLADEVLSSDNRADVSDRLKVLIDAEYVQREGKGRDQQTIKSHLMWMFASNSRTSAVVIEEGDRRYSVFSNHNPVAPDYAQMLKDLFLPGGVMTEAFEKEVAAFKFYLQGLTVDKGFVARPYDNSARTKLIEASLPSHEAFFQEMVLNGIDSLIQDVPDYNLVNYNAKYKPKDWDFGELGVSTQAIYDAYKYFCKQQGMYALKLNKLGAAIQGNPAGWKWARASRDNRRVSVYAVPRTPKET